MKTGLLESQAEADELANHTKCGNVHCDWFILPLLLLTPTIWFLVDRKWRSCKWSQKKKKTFWFFQLWFCCTYDSASDSNFWFSLSHKHSCDSAYDFDYDFIASENQPLLSTQKFCRLISTHFLNKFVERIFSLVVISLILISFSFSILHIDMVRTKLILITLGTNRVNRSISQCQLPLPQCDPGST